LPHPGCYNPRKDTQHPLYGRLGKSKGQSELVQKILLALGFDPQTVQPLAVCYLPHYPGPDSSLVHTVSNIGHRKSVYLFLYLLVYLKMLSVRKNERDHLEDIGIDRKVTLK